MRRVACGRSGRQEATLENALSTAAQSCPGVASSCGLSLNSYPRQVEEYEGRAPTIGGGPFAQITVMRRSQRDGAGLALQTFQRLFNIWASSPDHSLRDRDTERSQRG